MNQEKAIGLQAAAKLAGKSPRQLMRDIKAKKLPAKGGGRGIPYILDKESVESFKTSQSGIISKELLARIVYSFQTGTLQHHNALLQLWKWRGSEEEPLIEKNLRLLPKLDNDVFPLKYALQRICQSLEPEEIDLLAAMFIDAGCWLVYDAGEDRALSNALEKIKTEKPWMFASLQRFLKYNETEMSNAWQAIEEFVKKDIPGSLTVQQRKDYLAGERELFFDPNKRDAAWQIFRTHHPIQTLNNTFLTAYSNGDRRAILDLTKDYEDKKFHKAIFAEVRHYSNDGGTEDLVPAALLSAAKKQHKWRENGKPVSCCNPSMIKIAAVLDIHKVQAMRIWRRIAEQIKPEGIGEIKEMLFLNDKDLRFWKGTYVYKGKEHLRYSWSNTTTRINRPEGQPVCPYCESSVSEDDTFCPYCKKYVLERRVSEPPRKEDGGLDWDNVHHT